MSFLLFFNIKNSDFAPFRAMKYGYSNARVRAMKSALLNREFFNELLKARSVEGIIEMLERTFYKEKLVQFSAFYSGSHLIQIATSYHFADIAKKLIRIAPHDKKETLYLMLTRWDILNAKILFNARRIGKKDEIKFFLLPIDSFNEEDIKVFLSASGEEVFYRFIRSRLGKKIISSHSVHLAELEKLFLKLDEAEIIKFETILDKFYYNYYSSLISQDKDLLPLLKLFRKEIDAKNISIVSRFKKHNISDKNFLKKYIIPNGLISVEKILSLFDLRNEEEIIKEGCKLLNIFSPPSNLLDFEIKVGKEIAKLKLEAFYRSSLSIGSLIGFLLLKEEEINNLRKIAIGKEFNLPEEKIVSTLIFAE